MTLTRERKRKPVGRRFVDQIQVVDGCWEWQGSRDPAGYGRMSMRCADGRHRPRLAHRVGYELVHGPIPDGLTLDHLCRNPRCVNPEHLEPVTQRENNLRAPECRSTINAAATHCPQGHPYDEKNTLRRRGGRECRACARERMARRRKELAA